MALYDISVCDKVYKLSPEKKRFKSIIIVLQESDNIQDFVCPAEGRERMHAHGRKTDNVKTLLVPSRRMWTIKLPQFNNPITIVNTIAGYDILRPNLAWYEIQTNKTYKW